MSNTVDPRKKAIIAEAKSWVGTPYHHQQRLKGVGVDCAQLLAGVAENVGIRDEIITPMDYSAEWHLHNEEEVMLKIMEDMGCKKTDTPEPGDIIAFRVGKAHGHLGILTSPITFVHAQLEGSTKGSVHGKVVEVFLNGDWAKRADLYYEFPTE